MAFAGPLRHGGHPIIGGTRYILVLFMYIENFAYHSFLSSCNQEVHCDKEAVRTFGRHEEEEDSNLIRNDGASRVKGTQSYVVYKETLQLMTALNKKHALAVSDEY